MSRNWHGMAIATAALILMTGPALADAIDGYWCHPDGRRFQISGLIIVTPAGSRTQGEYDRHHFSYTVPSTDPGAGTAIRMTLFGEMTVGVTQGDKPEETWNRCGPPISLIGLPAMG